RELLAGAARVLPHRTSFTRCVDRADQHRLDVLRRQRARQPRRGRGNAPRLARSAVLGRGVVAAALRALARPYSGADWKKLVSAPAEPATTITAQISRKMSTIRPPTVSGFRICEETVSSCTVVKNAASPNEWMSPFATPCSNE